VSALVMLLKSPQFGRVARLVGFTLLGALLSSPLAHTWLLRYPALGVAVGVLEALYRTAVPTKSAASAPIVPLPTTDPAPPPAKG
jgi:hypothetical protein